MSEDQEVSGGADVGGAIQEAGRIADKAFERQEAPPQAIPPEVRSLMPKEDRSPLARVNFDSLSQPEGMQQATANIATGLYDGANPAQYLGDAYYQASPSEQASMRLQASILDALSLMNAQIYSGGEPIKVLSEEERLAIGQERHAAKLQAERKRQEADRRKKAEIDARMESELERQAEERRLQDMARNDPELRRALEIERQDGAKASAAAILKKAREAARYGS